MRKLVFIGLVLIGLASCDSSIKNGDLVYLSLRDGYNLSLKSDGGFKCSDEGKEILVFLEQPDSSFILKTEKGLSIVLEDYYLFAKDAEPTKFMFSASHDDKHYISMTSNTFLGCNGQEVYQTNEPFIYIVKY